MCFDPFIPLYSFLSIDSNIDFTLPSPLCITTHRAHTPSVIVPPTISPPNHIHCVSIFYTFQSLPNKYQWNEVYQIDSDNKFLVDHLSIQASLDEPSILKIPVVYHTSGSCNQIRLFEGRFVYNKQIHLATKNIYRIVVPLSLRRNSFNFIHTTPIAGYICESKTLYRIKNIAEWI